MLCRTLVMMWLLSLSAWGHADDFTACSTVGSQIDMSAQKEIFLEKVNCLYEDIASRVGGERVRMENPEVQHKFRAEQRRLRAFADSLSGQIKAICPSLDSSCSLYQSAEGLHLILNRNAALEVARFEIPENMFTPLMLNSMSLAWLKATHLGLLKAQ